MTNGQAISLDPEFLRSLSTQITELDARLDRSTGSLTTHKNTVERELSSKHHADFNDNVTQMVDYVQDLPQEERVAFYLLVTSSLENTFGKEVDSYVETLAKQRAEESVPLSEEDEKKVREDRKKLNDQFKAAYNLLEQWGMDVASVPKPKIRRGSPGGARGPRQLSRFEYTINGTPVAGDKNGLGPIASTIFGVKVSELKKMVQASNPELDLSNAEDLPDEWSVDVPHPQTNDSITLAARRLEEFREEDEENGETDVADEATPEPTPAA